MRTGWGREGKQNTQKRERDGSSAAAAQQRQLLPAKSASKFASPTFMPSLEQFAAESSRTRAVAFKAFGGICLAPSKLQLYQKLTRWEWAVDSCTWQKDTAASG